MLPMPPFARRVIVERRGLPRPPPLRKFGANVAISSRHRALSTVLKHDVDAWTVIARKRLAVSSLVFMPFPQCRSSDVDAWTLNREKEVGSLFSVIVPCPRSRRSSNVDAWTIHCEKEVGSLFSCLYALSVVPKQQRGCLGVLVGRGRTSPRSHSSHISCHSTRCT
jgi:hypothetical protein